MHASLTQRLEALIREGATITLADGTTLGLADAAFVTDKRLWYCTLWPQDEFATHRLDITAVTELYGGTMLELLGAGGRVGVIAPMEPDERENWRWEAWQKERESESMSDFLRTVKSFALAEL
jgi:hypothetical protein